MSGETQRKAGTYTRLGRAQALSGSRGFVWVSGSGAGRRRSRSPRRAGRRQASGATRCFAGCSCSRTRRDRGRLPARTQLSPRSLQLTWVSVLGLPLLLIGAKLFGLYDRDETLLRKTTLDEAPKLFQVATLCALLAWLAGD